MATTTGPTPLTATQLSELLALTKQADTVELKLTVPESRSGFRSTIAALDIDPLDAQLRQVYFFDTPELVLNGHGLVARARRSQGGADDTVVKLRPVVPDDLPANCASCPSSVSRSTPCPAGSSARRRST